MFILRDYAQTVRLETRLSCPYGDLCYNCIVKRQKREAVMTYLGKGIYTLPSASRIIKIDSQKMRRWVNGYTRQRDAEPHYSEPLIKPEFKHVPDNAVLSFLDLMELLFIKNFVQHGISIQKIRKAAASAAALLNTSHPFAVRKMYTDGKGIFARYAEENKDPLLLDLIHRQFQFDEVIAPLLYENIDFDVYDCARKWWPDGKNSGVVLDPQRNFGRPILDRHNVRTELIYELYKTNHSLDEISDWYELGKDEIEVAIGFEKGLAA